MKRGRDQRGFAYVAAIVLLVVMAAMATAVVRLNTTQINNTNQDLEGSRASQAARGGIEWGLYRIKSGNCAGSTTLTDFQAGTGYLVTVKCSSYDFNEGEQSEGTALQKRVYRIEATACNGNSACPDDASAAKANYVERRRVATACLTVAGGDCYD